MFTALAAAVILALAGYGCGETEDAGRVMHISAGGRVKTMDPALAADLASRNIVAAFYDTLLQYDYTARPYKLIPSMLESMPVISQIRASSVLPAKKYVFPDFGSSITSPVKYSTVREFGPRGVSHSASAHDITPRQRLKAHPRTGLN